MDKSNGMYDSAIQMHADWKKRFSCTTQHPVRVRYVEWGGVAEKKVKKK